MKVLGLLLVSLVLLLSPAAAQALGPTVTAGCVARWPAVTTSAGVALAPADGTISYKIYLSTIAATGGPVLPPPGASIILASGTSVPICPTLTNGQQYAYWVAPVLTPPAPAPGMLPGTPAEGAPSVSVPFVMGTPAPVTKVPDPVVNPTITP